MSSPLTQEELALVYPLDFLPAKPYTPSMAISFMERMVSEARKRRLRVVELRRAGLSFVEIGGALGIGRTAAWRLWKEAEKKGETRTP